MHFCTFDCALPLHTMIPSYVSNTLFTLLLTPSLKFTSASNNQVTNLLAKPNYKVPDALYLYERCSTS